MTTRLHLHLGAHKTATTSFQRLLHVNSKPLRETFGVTNVRPTELHALEAYRLISHARAGRAIAEDAVERARAELDAWLHAFGTDVVVSNEGLVGQHNLSVDGAMYPGITPAMAMAARLFASFDTSVSFVVRAQPAFLESTYMQAVHYGNYMPFDDYVTSIDLASMSWTRTIGALRDAFGARAVSVVPFEAVKAGEEDFFAELIRPLLGERAARFIEGIELGGDGKQNSSLSQTALTILDRTHGVLEPDDRKALIGFMRTALSNQTHPRAKPCPARLRKQLLEYFGEENTALFATMDPRYARYVEQYRP